MNKIRATLLCLLIMVPLIAAARSQHETANLPGLTLPELIYDSSEHFSDINSVNLDGLLERIGNSRLVLLGESSHGSAEFYDMRARITRELIEKKGFTIIAVEANWPDSARVNSFIQGSGPNPLFNRGLFSNTGASDFPSWMWANHSVLSLVHWLKDYNLSVNSSEDAVGFYGLDIFNMSGAIEAVLNYLQQVDPTMAAFARSSYACMMPWIKDPSIYSRVMQSGRHNGCGYEVFAVWQNLLKKRALYRQANTQRYFNTLQNARLIRNAELFYRNFYNQNYNTWNQRDQHMFDTLQAILKYRGSTSKAIIWAHNLHTGDARAMQMHERSEFNLGQRVRESFGDNAYLIGFGTNHGTVAAASAWGKQMQVMEIPPAYRHSYERLFHNVKTDNFLLPLRQTGLSYSTQELTRQKLLAQRLQRSIGVTFDPNSEVQKNYSYASLPSQFDEYIWFDETRALKPLSRKR